MPYYIDKTAIFVVCYGRTRREFMRSVPLDGTKGSTPKFYTIELKEADPRDVVDLHPKRLGFTHLADGRAITLHEIDGCEMGFSVRIRLRDVDSNAMTAKGDIHVWPPLNRNSQFKLGEKMAGIKMAMRALFQDWKPVRSTIDLGCYLATVEGEERPGWRFFNQIIPLDAPLQEPKQETVGTMFADLLESLARWFRGEAKGEQKAAANEVEITDPMARDFDQFALHMVSITSAHYAGNEKIQAELGRLDTKLKSTTLSGPANFGGKPPVITQVR